MDNLIEYWKDFDEPEKYNANTKELEFVRALCKALDQQCNYIKGISKCGDISRKTVRRHAKSMENEGKIAIKKEGRSKFISFTDSGLKYLEELKKGLEKDIVLEKTLVDFKKQFLRWPTRKEIRINYNGEITDRKIAALPLNYVEPSEDAIKKQDEKLWLILCNTLRVHLESTSKFELLTPIADEDSDLTSILNSDIESYIESRTEFNAETFLEHIDSETIAIKEEQRKPYIAGKQGRINYSRIHVKLPEPYYSYFGSNGQQYLKFISRPKADPINFSAWENLKFKLKKYLPGQSQVRRLY